MDLHNLGSGVNPLRAGRRFAAGQGRTVFSLLSRLTYQLPFPAPFDPFPSTRLWLTPCNLLASVVVINVGLAQVGPHLDQDVGRDALSTPAAVDTKVSVRVGGRVLQYGSITSGA